jgi:hypothetical protein
MINAYPLAWPAGWPRTPESKQKRGKFHRTERQYSNTPGGGSWLRKRDTTIADGVARCLAELQRFGAVRDDIVISTNVPVRLDGLPRGDAKEPTDPGAAVYWRAGASKSAPKVMAIDMYDRVADNLAAIAATLEAMRAIERHGGAQILDRAFTGFTQLAAPVAMRHWRDVLGVGNVVISADELELAYKRARSAAHPDNDGKAEEFDAVQRAYEDACAELGFAP